jgi:predicted dehydrogenase
VEKTNIGIIGCGKISGIYLENLTRLFANTEVIACSDLIQERAAAAAEEFGVPKACSTSDLLADPEVELVVNLTIPGAHAEVSLAALQAGKHVYMEKPLAVERQDGIKVLDAAAAGGLWVGGAPDTFLGGGIQTCRKLIDDGWIGEPVAATAFMTTPGHERWHPDPEFYYKKGGGPMFDMGPYYLTALINLLGPVKRLTGATRISYPERTITSEPKYGEKIAVEVPTHVTGVLEFSSGPVGTILTSFDIWGANLPRIEIYGTTGSLSVPDPNTFGGPVRILSKGRADWQEVPLVYGYTENSRGLGVADMAAALERGREPRANGELLYHVLDLMEGFHEAADSGRHYEAKSTCKRPEPLPLNLAQDDVG